MRWEDERYVRAYTRDTGEWLALGWEAQALFLFALRKADRAGIVHTGKARARGMAGMTGMPLEVVDRALPLLLADGCVRESEGGYIIPNFIHAQEVAISDAQRKRDQRERDRDKAMAAGGPVSKTAADSLAEMSRRTVTRGVTEDGHTMASRPDVTPESHAVTEGGHAGEVTPNRAVPSLAVPSSASQGTASPSQGEDFELKPTGKPPKAPRKQSPQEELYGALQKAREDRCAEVSETFIPDGWSNARQNKDLGADVKASAEAQERFSVAWGIYLADDGNRVREPAWALGWFMAGGVRARYETQAARELEGEAA